jgi:CheY-specific phosphatase CheX
MLGNEEEKTTVKEQMDAFKEVTNILCGNLLPKIAGPEKVFDIETPMILEPVIESDSEQWELIGEIIFTIDETDAKLQLFIESPVPNELLKL